MYKTEVSKQSTFERRSVHHWMKRRIFLAGRPATRIFEISQIRRDKGRICNYTYADMGYIQFVRRVGVAFKWGEQRTENRGVVLVLVLTQGESENRLSRALARGSTDMFRNMKLRGKKKENIRESMTASVESGCPREDEEEGEGEEEEEEEERRRDRKPANWFAPDEQSRAARVIATERAEVALLGTWHC
ncbi:hypothetical protein K0M31_008048 [Melipona bicolor]|uniref:Uncharacterized protein n=1 Tax=Melipona bicolor TaxID=60889 RepID=A0AA40GCJ9_9HYME|nr:hypothetical protein K0M31_008048 [Melipona bicolor]